MALNNLTKQMIANFAGRLIIRIVLVLLLLTVFVGYLFVMHLRATDYHRALRLTYPIELPLVKSSLHCSQDSPEWLGLVSKDIIELYGSNAIQVAHIDHQDRVFHCEGGWKGKFFRSPKISADSRFRYASITKLVTADAILRLIEKGELTLDTKLQDVLSGISFDSSSGWQRVTIEHLLRHEFGRDRARLGDLMLSAGENAVCPNNLNELPQIKLQFTPGSQQKYSNLGYCLLGVVLEKKTGKRFRTLIEELYDLPSRGIKFVDGPYLDDEPEYNFRNQNLYNRKYYKKIDFQAASSSFGLSGSATAYARMLKDISANDRKLRLTSFEDGKNCNPHLFRSCYGFAFYRYKSIGSEMVFHIQEGYIPGVSTLVVYDAFGGVTVILVSGNPMGGFLEKKTKIYVPLLDNIASNYKYGSP